MSIKRRLMEFYWNLRYDVVEVVWPEEKVQLEIRKENSEYHKYGLDPWVRGHEITEGVRGHETTEVKIVTRKVAERDYDSTPCDDFNCYGYLNDSYEKKLADVKPEL